MTEAFNFLSDKYDEDTSIKLNMDELFIKKQQQDLNVMNYYNKILKRIHNKILFTSKNLANNQCCWYVIPEVIIGIPKYDNKDCTVYVIHKLRENGFIVKYIHPNLLFISWSNWIPSYVRNEIKKKTGHNIDEYGNLIYENDNEINNESNLNNNNIILNNYDNNTKNKDKKNYKDIKTYNPSGTLIYNNNLLRKLDLNS